MAQKYLWPRKATNLQIGDIVHKEDEKPLQVYGVFVADGRIHIADRNGVKQDYAPTDIVSVS